MDETKPAASAEQFVPPTILEGKYRIERVIGEGSFGRVYLATDPRLRRSIAIKELLADRRATDPEVFARYQDRFSREARAGGAITHANVVTVYEMGIDHDQNTYLVMEYVDGTNLRDLLMQVGTLPPERAVAVALDIAHGLEAVHEADIVHRDLKPANIMISRRGNAKVGDFGIAQVGTESQRTQVTMGHPGTPLYMSPEQASGFGYVDGRSDLFSLGLIIHEMLVGEPYLRRRVPIEQAKPNTPPALAAIVHHLLERDPNLRFQSASDVATELSRLSSAPQPGANFPANTNYPPLGPLGNAAPPPGPYVNMPGVGPPIQGGNNAPGYGGYDRSSGYGQAPPTGYPSGAPGGPNVPPQPYGRPPTYGAQPPYNGNPGQSPYRSGSPPPGPPPPYTAGNFPYSQPPRRGLSTGAVFGIIGGAVLFLIIAGIAAVNGNHGNGGATATTDAGVIGTPVANVLAPVSGTITPARTPTASAQSSASATASRPTAFVPFWATQTAQARGAGTSALSRGTANPVTPGGGGTTLTDKNNRYSLMIPKDWQAQQSSNPNTDLEVIGSDPPGVLRTVSQTTPTALSLDAAALSVLTGLKQANNTFMQVGPTQNATVNGQPAKRIEFTLTDSGVDLRGVMYVLTKGKLVVGVAFFAAPDDLDTVLMQTHAALDTFMFTAP